MAQFKYKARASDGSQTEGTIDAASLDLAVTSLQRRNFLVLSIEPTEAEIGFMGQFAGWFGIFESVPTQDIVVLTRQLSTLFEAKVPIVESLKILIGETSNRFLKNRMASLLDDIQAGMPMSQAMAKHPEVFSKFYVAMVRSGEESGKLESIFGFLADYLERSFELTRKARNAMIYPIFVLAAFIAVMTLMLVFVIPNLSSILIESGQTLPIYTRAVIGLSNFIRSFGIVFLVIVAAMIVLLVRYSKTESGRLYFSRLTLSWPVFGGLYKKIYLSRIADNLHTLLSGGLTVTRSLEITSDVVGNEIYRKILLEAVDSVKSGSMISSALGRFEDIPPLLSQMIRIGEETGKLDYILNNIAGFYRRDVDNLVDNLVSLIEPTLIVALGLGVGVLVAAVLVPIYSISTSAGI